MKKTIKIFTILIVVFFIFASMNIVRASNATTGHTVEEVGQQIANWAIKFCNEEEQGMYTVVYDDLEDIEVIDIDYGIVTGNNEYLKAYNYWKNNQDLTYYGSSNGHKIDPGSYTNLKNSSLKSNNFSVYVNYVKESRGQHYLTIYRNLYNLTSIRSADSYKGVYYLPLYIDITYNICD